MKRARLTTRRSAARPNGKSKATSESAGLVPRPSLQKPPSRGLEGSGGEGGGDEGLKVEGGFTFGRLHRRLNGASTGLEGGFKGGLKGASRGLHLEPRGLEALKLQGGLKPSALKGASRMLEGGFKGA